MNKFCIIINRFLTKSFKGKVMNSFFGKTFVQIVVFLAIVFLADKTCPTYDDHYDSIYARLVQSGNQPKDMASLFIKTMGSGFNTLANTGCKTISPLQFNVASVCRYDDKKVSFMTVGVFSKVFVINM